MRNEFCIYNNRLRLLICRMVNEFNEIYDIIITCIFLWTLSTVCCNLILLQTQLVDNTNVLNAIRTIFLAFWSFVVKMEEQIATIYPYQYCRVFVKLQLIYVIMIQVIYLVCILGQRMTDQFDEFNDELHQCNWFTFPMGMQKMYAIFVHNAQQQMGLQGYGNLLCSRDTMKRVIASDIEYVLRYVRYKYNAFSFHLLDTERKLLIFYDTSPIHLSFVRKLTWFL